MNVETYSRNFQDPKKLLIFKIPQKISSVDLTPTKYPEKSPYPKKYLFF